MKRSALVFCLLTLVLSAWAEPSSDSLAALKKSEVTVVMADGAEIRGQLGAFNDEVVVLIKPDGEILEILRKDVKVLLALKDQVQAAAPARPAIQESKAATKPAPPDLATLRGGSEEQRRAAYEEFLKMTAVTNGVLQMGLRGSSMALFQWEAVLKEAPRAFELYTRYGTQSSIALVCMLVGSPVIVAGLILTAVVALSSGPIALPVILDLGGAGILLIQLLLSPTLADTRKIADAYNTYVRAELKLQN